MARSLGEKIGAGGRRRGGFYTPSPKSARWVLVTPGTRSKDPGHPGVQDPGHPEWSETNHPRPGTRGSRTPGTWSGQGGLGLLPDSPQREATCSRSSTYSKFTVTPLNSAACL